MSKKGLKSKRNRLSRLSTNKQCGLQRCACHAQADTAGEASQAWMSPVQIIGAEICRQFRPLFAQTYLGGAAFAQTYQGSLIVMPLCPLFCNKPPRMYVSRQTSWSRGLLNKSSHQLSCRWFGVKNLKSFGQHRLIGDRTSRTGRAAFISCSGDIFHTDLGIPKWTLWTWNSPSQSAPCSSVSLRFDSAWGPNHCLGLCVSYPCSQLRPWEVSGEAWTILGACWLFMTSCQFLSVYYERHDMQPFLLLLGVQELGTCMCEHQAPQLYVMLHDIRSIQPFGACK